jgi:hypothetical protein
MTIRNISSINKVARYSWMRLTAINAALLLAAVGAASNAHADVAATPAHHTASTPSRDHKGAVVHGRAAAQHSVKAKTDANPALQEARAEAASLSDGDELTPVHGSVPSATRTGTSLADSASSMINQLTTARAAPSPWRGHGAPAGNLLPGADTHSIAGDLVTATMTTPDTATGSFGDLLHGAGGGMTGVPAPAAWSVLLFGLLGLPFLMRSPQVARARAWATATPASGRSATSGKAKGWAVDRVDPDRYSLAPAGHSRQGYFVRGAAASRFGADAQ